MTEQNGKLTQKDLYDAINDFRKEVNMRFDTLERNYVTRIEFEPIQQLVNRALGVGGMILLGILGLVITHVIPDFKL